ncbi:Serine carboxypeptidase-like 51, partial [Striga hermonthica]
MDKKAGVTLQFGPGGSGAGIGNFLEIGPLDVCLKPRNSTWLKKGDLLFVDNPVGTGYSYVEDTNLLVKTDDENAADITTLLIQVVNSQKSLQNRPLYIVGESYGGKIAVTLALSALKAIKNGTLKLKLGGVALGNSWISPIDYVFSWGPLLSDVSRLDNNGLLESNSVANQIKQQLDAGKFAEATGSVDKLQDVIIQTSNAVNMYNFLYDQSSHSSSSQSTSEFNSEKMRMKGYSRYLNSLATTSCDGDLDTVLNYLHTLMNGKIKQKLKIIPESLKWELLANPVYEAMAGDFMKPRIEEVNQLLAQGVNVTIYNGQLDVACATKGTEAWVQKLKWSGLNRFLLTKRNPFYCGVDPTSTAGFVKSYNNLKFYWILGAGHL